MNILSSVRHVRIVRALNTGVPIVTKPSTMAIVVALVLAAAGLAMAVYLSRELAYEMNAGEGIISKPSKYSVPETLHRLETILTAKGIRFSRWWITAAKPKRPA